MLLIERELRSYPNNGPFIEREHLKNPTSASGFAGGGEVHRRADRVRTRTGRPQEAGTMPKYGSHQVG